MPSPKMVEKLVARIDARGALLAFPVNNRPEPRSLWSELYPRSEMRWEWDDSGDNRVADLWHVRERLSSSGRVVYAKWYQGRATFFSREVFVRLLAALETHRFTNARALGPEARRIYEALEMDSPLSTRQLKRSTELQGRANERAYERGCAELWSRLLIVAFGEVDEGAFPSLAVGATRLLFEDLWNEARALDAESATRWLERKLGAESLFYRYLGKLRRRA